MNIATLSFWTYVDALILATLIQLFERDGIVVVRVVLDALLMCVATIVEQDTSTGDPVL